jgi:hypothetical protein
MDKEGIISESTKYVDEIGVINRHEQKVVFDLIHDSHVTREEEIYSFENINSFKENNNLLKALGLSLMSVKNPKETDNDTKLREVFSKDPQLSDQIKTDIGYYFHNALTAETEAHQDCVCSLAKLIGHSETSYQNFEAVTSVWNIKENFPVEQQ